MQTASLKLYLTEDFQEAARAFAEKRQARTFQGPLNPPARGRYGILLSRSATRLSRRDVVERERIVMVEPRRTGMSMSSSGSHATPRWREQDSNPRSRVKERSSRLPRLSSPSRWVARGTAASNLYSATAEYG